MGCSPRACVHVARPCIDTSSKKLRSLIFLSLAEAPCSISGTLISFATLFVLVDLV